MNKIKLMGYVALLLVGAVALAVAGFSILLTPQNALLRHFRGPIAESNAGIVTGPYPLEEDLVLLKSQGVGLVISLLDANIPYEKVLLERETQLGDKIGLRVENYPMGSLLGHRFGEQSEENAKKAANAALAAPSRVYVHCYLGVHRVKSVEEFIHQKGASSARYRVRAPNKNPAL